MQHIEGTSNRHAQIKVHGSGSTNHDMRFKYQYEGSGITFYLRIHINFITNPTDHLIVLLIILNSTQ